MAISPVNAESLQMLAPRGLERAEPFRPLPTDGEKVDNTSPFQALFEKTVGETNHTLVDAEQKAKDFAEGKSDDIHGTMIAVTEADIQLRLLGTMKNKVVDAFYELWRMQI